MPVSEETRHRVYEAFKSTYGAVMAGSIMAMLPPAGVPELATKADLAVIEARLGERIESALRQQHQAYTRLMLTAVALTGTLAGTLGGLVARLG